MLDEKTLVRRAWDAYFRAGKREAWRGGQVMQPSRDSGLVMIGGKPMVHFFNVSGTLAMYEPLPSGRIRKVQPDKWPDEMRQPS